MSKSGRMRIDKWLWVARFFKTRSLASTAIASHKIKCNGEHVKPARELKVVNPQALAFMREANWPASLSLYWMCGLVWYWNGSLNDLLKQFRRKFDHVDR